MINILKSPRILIFVSVVCLFCFAAMGMAQEKATMIIKIDKQGMAVEGTAGKTETRFSGDIVYEIGKVPEGVEFKLISFGLVGLSINTKQGKSGNISISLKPESAQTTYNPKERIIESQFLGKIHYRLIDRIKGYIPPKKGEKEIDDFRSYFETFSCQLTCRLSEDPIIDEAMEMKKGAAIDMKMVLTEKVLGEITKLEASFTAIDVKTIWILYLYRRLNVCPVFIRYTPEDGCSTGETATTGGSFSILRDRAIEMWRRCCIGLTFLTPVYVDNDDYRILSSAESANLRAEYDDPNAVEVFFVEVSDPVGMWGGGVCYSGGSANAQIITFDTNLPINLYNLAHELGHALGLSHPPGNSTPGSLMEPSGFCRDNPALMSDENCDNANNPLLRIPWWPFRICIRRTNMP